MKKIIITIIGIIMAMSLVSCGNVEIEPVQTTVRDHEYTDVEVEIEKKLFDLYEIGAISMDELQSELEALHES